MTRICSLRLLFLLVVFNLTLAIRGSRLFGVKGNAYAHGLTVMSIF